MVLTFRLEMSKLLGRRRKTYTLDVDCRRFYFGKVYEEVLGQRSGQDISTPRTEGLSVCQWSVPEKKAGWFRKCLCKYSTEVPRFVLKILEESKVIASMTR